jgi:hypothetical protein
MLPKPQVRGSSPFRDAIFASVKHDLTAWFDITSLARRIRCGRSGGRQHRCYSSGNRLLRQGRNRRRAAREVEAAGLRSPSPDTDRPEPSAAIPEACSGRNTDALAPAVVFKRRGRESARACKSSACVYPRSIIDAPTWKRLRIPRQGNNQRIIRTLDPLRFLTNANDG